MRDCDHCGEIAGTAALGSMLVYCKPCLEEASDEFAVDFGYITQEVAKERARERQVLREAMVSTGC